MGTSDVKRRTKVKVLTIPSDTLKEINGVYTILKEGFVVFYNREMTEVVWQKIQKNFNKNVENFNIHIISDFNNYTTEKFST